MHLHRRALRTATHLLLMMMGACVSSAAAGPPPAVTLATRSDCTGRCTPSLVELADGTAMALWAAENGVLWAQRIPRGARDLTGIAIKVGQLTTGTGPIDDQPIAVALPSGDLALV